MATMALPVFTLNHAEIARRVAVLKRRRRAAGLGDPSVGTDLTGDTIYQNAAGSCYTTPANAPAPGPYYVTCPAAVATLPPENLSVLLDLPEAAPATGSSAPASFPTNSAPGGTGGPGPGGINLPTLKVPAWVWWVLAGLGVVLIVTVVKR